MAIPLAIDTDPGIDDALALLLAWSSPEIDVGVVTPVAGNVDVDAATKNLLRLVALRRPAPAPRIARGAGKPLGKPLHTATSYHGEDGLGDVPSWPPVDVDAVPGDAVATIVETARRHGARLTLVALGPLTNVALAFREDPGAMASVGRLVVMGGAVDVPGNVTPTAEFNVWVDPDAAAEVFRAAREIDLVPLDATRQTVLAPDELERALARRPGDLASRVRAFSERGFRVEATRGTPGLVLHDPLAIGVAIDPTLVRWERARLDVNANAETRRVAGPANCRIARDVDRDRFVATFLDRLVPA